MKEKNMKLASICSFVLLSGLLCGLPNSVEAENPSDKAAEFRFQKRLFLPPHIYAVPGLETNIYYRNVFQTVNPAGFVFVVNCPKGRDDARRWRFVPSKKDAGKVFPLTLQVRDDEGIVAEAKTQIHVVPSDAGSGRKISLLMIGDSLTAQVHFPTRVHALFQKAGNPELVMIGSHSGGGKPVVPGGVAIEGYGGWSYQVFLTRWQPEVEPYKYRKRSKFLMEKDGRRVFSLNHFLEKYNQGKKPDFITIQLGTNDVFALPPSQRIMRINQVVSNARTLLRALRKDAPDAVIGVGYTPFAAGQDAFGKFSYAYPGKENSWNLNRNVFLLNQKMTELAAQLKDPKLFLIPMQLNLDCENNFPVEEEAVNAHNPKKVVRQSNNVHPAKSGYYQMGDTLYSFLKYQLYRQEVENRKQ